MPGQDASFFDARNLIDDNDLQQQIDQAENIPVTEELRLVVRDVFLHGGPVELNARQAINEAKANAFRKARKKLVQRLRAEVDAVAAKHVFPWAQNKAVQQWLDENEGIKVKP